MSVMICSAAHVAAIRTTLEHYELGTCEALHALRVVLRHPRSYTWKNLHELVDTWQALNWASYHAKYQENLDPRALALDVQQGRARGQLLSLGQLYMALSSMLYNIEAEEVEQFRPLDEREQAAVRDLERIYNSIAHHFARNLPEVRSAKWTL